MSDETTVEAGAEPVQPAPAEPVPSSATEPASVVPPPGQAEAVETAPVRPERGGSRAAELVNIVLGIAFLMAVGGVAFAAGRMTAPATAAAAGGLSQNGTGSRAGNGGFPDGGFGGPGGLAGQDGQRRGDLFGLEAGVTIEGTVESSSADTLTIKTASGQTIQVALNGTTTYHAETSARSSDVKTGGTVIVRVGLRQPDGSGTTTGPTASDVTIVP